MSTLILYGLVIIGVVMLVVVILRTFITKASGNEGKSEPERIVVDADAAAAHLSTLVQKKTVSSRNKDGWDPAEFEAFRKLLPLLYPEAHRVLTLTLIDGHAMVYRWKGKAQGESLVLMSHYDVVPADDSGWTRPAFSGDIHDGKVWGRGTIDTKCTLVCALEAVEALVKEGFVPEHDVYLSFGYNEETSGGGTPAIVAYLRDNGIKPGLVFDEGGAVVEGIFPGISKPLAMVGVAEKGVSDIELSVVSAGGHSSTPPKKGAAWRLARAIMRLEAKPSKAKFPDATIEMFRRLGPHATFGLRLVFSNLWLFEPLLRAVFASSGGELNAICRTTTVVTMLEGSQAANVLPPRVKAVVNVRIAIDDSVGAVLARMRRAIDDHLVELRVIEANEPSAVSDMHGERFEALSETIKDVYPDAVVAPYVVLGGTDARHYAEESSSVYRFSPFTLSKAERASMHAVNEAIPIASLAKGVEFYLRLIRRAG